MLLCLQVLKHPWSRRLDVDFVVTGPIGQPVHAPVWQSMWSCVQSDLREACTAYASPHAKTGFNSFGWSMPHLKYDDVEQVRLYYSHSPCWVPHIEAATLFQSSYLSISSGSTSPFPKIR